MKAHYATHVLKQSINIKTMCPNYILEFRNTQSHRRVCQVSIRDNTFNFKSHVFLLRIHLH